MLYRFLGALALGQVASLLVTMTGFAATELALQGKKIKKTKKTIYLSSEGNSDTHRYAGTDLETSYSFLCSSYAWSLSCNCGDVFDCIFKNFRILRCLTHATVYHDLLYSWNLSKREKMYT